MKESHTAKTTFYRFNKILEQQEVKNNYQYNKLFKIKKYIIKEFQKYKSFD